MSWSDTSELASVRAGGESERYRYDPAGRLLRYSDPGGELSYTYDGDGRLASRSYPSGSSRYSYDADGLLVGAQTPAGQSSYCYDGTGRLVRTTMPNATTERRGYDDAGRLTGIRDLGPRGQTIARLAYTLDDASNPTRIKTDTGAIAYAYDSRQRLVDACLDDPCEDDDPARLAYSYDALSNLTEQSQGGETTTYSHDASSRLTSSSGPAGDASYSYDPAGYMTAISGPDDGDTSYSYDAAGRLTKLDSPEATQSYSYGPSGRRVGAESPGQGADGKLDYLWDPSFSLGPDRRDLRLPGAELRLRRGPDRPERPRGLELPPHRQPRLGGGHHR